MPPCLVEADQFESAHAALSDANVGLPPDQNIQQFITDIKFGDLMPAFIESNQFIHQPDLRLRVFLRRNAIRLIQQIRAVFHHIQFKFLDIQFVG